MKGQEYGFVNLWIDELDPCLRNIETGELEETAVFRIESRSYLKKFQKKNGWYINWNTCPKDMEVYALVLKETNEIQGLIAMQKDIEAKAAYIYWACTAPWNNIYKNHSKKYAGVGGHLFAIAADKSTQWGFDGAIYGFAANKELLEHYEKIFHAQHIGMRHQYHFFIDELNARNLMEVYTYEWNNKDT